MTHAEIRDDVHAHLTVQAADRGCTPGDRDWPSMMLSLAEDEIASYRARDIAKFKAMLGIGGLDARAADDREAHSHATKGRR